MKMPFYNSNRCRYGATEKNVFLRVMTIFKKGRHFEPEVKNIFNVSAIKCCFLDLTILNFIGITNLVFKRKFDILNLKKIDMVRNVREFSKWPPF